MTSIVTKRREIRKFQQQLKSQSTFTYIENLNIDANLVTRKFRDLPQLIAKDVVAARQKLARMIGTLELTPEERQGSKYLNIKARANMLDVLETCGVRELPKNRIAGAGFEPATFGL